MINSLSSYTNFGRKGVSGLMSGLDTDEIVKGMTSATTTKMAKLLQNKQSLAWKTDGYRSISTKLISFADKYMSFASKDNIFSDRFFEGATVTPTGVNSKYVTATGSSNTSGSLSITNIKQTASTATYFSSNTLSSNVLSTGGIDFSQAGKEINNLAGQTMNIEYEGKTYDITFGKDFKGKTGAEVATEFNRLLGEAKIGDTDNLGKHLQLSVNAESKKFELTMTKDDKGTAKIAGASSQKVIDMFNLKLGGTVKDGSPLVASKEVDDKSFIRNLKFNETIKDKTLTFELNGIRKNITFNEEELKTVTDMDTFTSKLNEKLAKSFGTVDRKVKNADGTYSKVKENRVVAKQAEVLNKDGTKLLDADGKQVYRLDFSVQKLNVDVNDVAILDVNGNETMTTDTPSKLKFSSDDVGIMGQYDGIFTMKNGATNKIEITGTLENLGGINFDKDGKGELTINDVKIAYTKTDSIKSMIDKINASAAGVKVTYMGTSDNLSVVSTESGSQGRIDISDSTKNAVDKDGNIIPDTTPSGLTNKLFGKEAVTDADLISNGQKGKDAIIEIQYDGSTEKQTIIRSSNSFDIDGMTITLAPDAEKFTHGVGNEIRFSAKPNTDAMVKGIQDMVKDYNEIIDLVNKSVSERPNRKYAPLTDQQREGMTDDQIKIWEDNAKAGILFGDPDLRAMTTELRFAFSFDVAGAGSLADMGITTSTTYSDNGKITIDEDLLRAAIEKNPEEIKKAFITTNPDPKTKGKDIEKSGLMERVQAITDKYAKTTGSEKGKLIQIAGLKDSMTELNSIHYKKSKDIDKQLESLKNSLKLQEDRYYSEFTRLEQYISQMNAQSSWLTEQTGG